MSIEKHFCSTPWIHIRVTRSGDMEICRWADRNVKLPTNSNISNLDLNEFFSNNPVLKEFRLNLLDGKKQDLCSSCYKMELHGKVSGRDKQLLKVGVYKDEYLKSLKSSPFNDAFVTSYHNQGATDMYPLDWQIDLGNYCNSSCISCDEESSSKLLTEFKKIGIINPRTTYNFWVDNPDIVNRFSTYLASLSKVQYLHFIGGETLITPAFKQIIKALVISGASKEITLGFTTNLTVWDEETFDLFKKFKQINVGLSVETLTPINNYVRFPSKIEKIKEILDRWVNVAKENCWLIQLRTTPTCLSIRDLYTVYQYAFANDLAVESCNFLEKPKFLRPTVLPQKYREISAKNLSDWINLNKDTISKNQLVNIRDQNSAKIQLLQDAESYVNYLNTAADESHRLPELVAYLKKLESNRKNSILDYLPEYEQLFRSAGY